MLLKYVSHHHPTKEPFSSTVGKEHKERGTASRKRLRPSETKILIHA